MTNLFILGMNSNLLKSLKEILSKKEEKDVPTTISTFIGRHETEVLAVPIINRKSFSISEDLNDTSSIIKYYTLDNKREEITRELRSLGYNLKYKGTQYLIDTILEISENKDARKASLQTDFYPIIAKRYHKSVQNVKNCIKTATNSMYIECNIDVLKRYFNLYDDIKPTVRQVIFTVLDNIA